MECKWFKICPMNRFNKKGMLDKKWINDYCLGNNWNNCVRYKMEEKGEYHPDCMLPDGSIDERLRGY